MTSGSLWNYDRFEVNDSANEKNDTSNYRKNSNKTTTSKAFGYKTKIIGSCCYIKVFKKFLENPCFAFDLLWNRASLDKVKILCNIWNIKNIWSGWSQSRRYSINKWCIILNKIILNFTFQLSFCLLISIISDKSLEIKKQAFERTASWKKYRSEITTQSKKQ